MKKKNIEKKKCGSGNKGFNDLFFQNTHYTLTKACHNVICYHVGLPSKNANLVIP